MSLHHFEVVCLGLWADLYDYYDLRALVLPLLAASWSFAILMNRVTTLSDFSVSVLGVMLRADLGVYLAL